MRLNMQGWEDLVVLLLQKQVGYFNTEWLPWLQTNKREVCFGIEE